MSWHPTRRDLLLLLIVLVLFGLFLQLDFSFRFTDSKGSDSLLGFKFGIGGRRPGEYGSGSSRKPLSSDLDAHGYAGKIVASVSDAKVKWGEEGAVRTTVPTHAPGWTVFDAIYLYNGTWYIVTDHPSSIPLLRLMVSTGAEIWNDEESIKRREPTEKDMRIIFPSEAKRLFGNSASRVSGMSLLVNDPPQFLDHYYHYAAELLFGMWRTYSSLDNSINAAGQTQLPSPARMIMPHVAAGKWNDYAKMNSFITRAIFPGMSYEYRSDFLDRVDSQRAYLFDRVVFADRAAAFRGPEFAKTWRTASEAVTLGGSRYWWSPIRRNLLEFIGSGDKSEINLEDFGLEEAEDELELIETAQVESEARSGGKDEPVFDSDIRRGKTGKRAPPREETALALRKEHSPANPVITYVSRQDWGRRMLKPQDHDVLVSELRTLEKKYGWEVNIVAMDKLTRDEQIRLAARTTIMMGVHGNGLTHLLWMNNLNPRATVMEFFFKGGFAYDYAFITHALEIRYFGWWGDEYFSHPDLPEVAYPEGFQGNEIALDGKKVANLVEQRLLIDRT